MKMIRNISVCLVAFLFFLCILASGTLADTHTAASCSSANVQTAINAASAGDTVSIPAGSCTWSSTVSITKPITLQGAGAGSTVITGATGQTTPMISYSPSPVSSTLMRVTGFTFNANNNSQFFQTSSNSINPIPRIRYDHNTLSNGVSNANEPFRVNGNVYGVIDSNTISGSLHLDRDGTQRAAWDNLTFTFGTSENLYIEDNIYTGVPNNTPPVGAGWGSRYVFRYNTLTLLDNQYPLLDYHGNQDSGVHGTMGVEIYGNLITCSISNSEAKIHARGGKSVVFWNKSNNCYGMPISLNEECPDNMSVTNYTSGLFSGASNGQPEHISDTYVWNNRLGTTLNQPFLDEDCCNQAVANGCGSPNPNCCYNGAGQPSIKENVDWFKQATSFNGTAGIGCGTLAQMNAITPTVEGVGFWVTTQSCSSIDTANVGANAVAPLSGTLYKNIGGIWTAYYTPYTYPHPLRTGDTMLRVPVGVRVVPPQ